MPKNKRLHFKDLDTLRFFAFVPVFVFSVLYLTTNEREGIYVQLTNLFAILRVSSFDFFFFISAFLLTSHGLREYKYNQNFSLKNFFIRRMMRLSFPLILLLLFIFLFYPMVIETLKLNVVGERAHYDLFLLFPEYYSSYSNEQYIFLSALWTIFSFGLYYFIWGFVLKYTKGKIAIVAIIFILSGIIMRFVADFLETSWVFNPLAYGVTIGLGALTAKAVREELPFIQTIKNSHKKLLLLFYLVGGLFIQFGYLISGSSFFMSFFPIFSGLFLGIIVIDQTFGKNAPLKFRNLKLMSQVGRISFGFFVYYSIINVLTIIGIESLNFETNQLTVKIIFALVGFVLSWIIADISFNYIEKPLLRFRREFKNT